MRYRTLSLLFVIMSFMTAAILFISCEKEKMPYSTPVYKIETDSIMDVDSNWYRTVKIGDQWWMAENLKVRHYRNNVSLYYNSSMSPSEWAGLKKGAYCYLNDNAPFNGLLYNGYALIDTNILAPEGWRIPTDDDWKKLEKFIGMNEETANNTGWRGTNEGEKLKLQQSGGQDWDISIDIKNTNESGFSALSGGCRLYDGYFGDSNSSEKLAGFWWTSSLLGSDQFWFRSLEYNNGGVFRYFAPKESGFSIRCIKE